jgi:hypothetical protein
MLHSSATKFIYYRDRGNLIDKLGAAALLFHDVVSGDDAKLPKIDKKLANIFHQSEDDKQSCIVEQKGWIYNFILTGR